MAAYISFAAWAVGRTVEPSGLSMPLGRDRVARCIGLKMVRSSGGEMRIADGG